jgi:hypothetical protein
MTLFFVWKLSFHFQYSDGLLCCSSTAIHEDLKETILGVSTYVKDDYFCSCPTSSVYVAKGQSQEHGV